MYIWIKFKVLPILIVHVHIQVLWQKCLFGNIVFGSFFYSLNSLSKQYIIYHAIFTLICTYIQYDKATRENTQKKNQLPFTLATLHRMIQHPSTHDSFEMADICNNSNRRSADIKLSSMPPKA